MTDKSLLIVSRDGTIDLRASVIKYLKENHQYLFDTNHLVKLFGLRPYTLFTMLADQKEIFNACEKESGTRLYCYLETFP